MLGCRPPIDQHSKRFTIRVGIVSSLVALMNLLSLIYCLFAALEDVRRIPHKARHPGSARQEGYYHAFNNNCAKCF